MVSIEIAIMVAVTSVIFPYSAPDERRRGCGRKEIWAHRGDYSENDTRGLAIRQRE